MVILQWNIFGNQLIKPDASVKLLGVDIDDKLNIKKHIKHLCKTADAILNAIKRLRIYLDDKERKLLIEAYVISKCNYSTTVWYFCELVRIHRMEKLHERCIRFISNEYDKKYFDILAEKKLTLYKKIILIMCCETYKTKNGLNAASMMDIFENWPSKYPSTNEKICIYLNITNWHNSCRVQGAKLWNYLPNEIKDAASYETFQKGIK